LPNANKRKGDTFERVMRDFFRIAGFPGAERTKAGYERDAGDIHMDPVIGVGPGVICQCKNVVTPRWTEWLAGLEEQIAEARADFGFIAWKRRGIGRPEDQLAVMSMTELVRLLRAAGYGTPLEDEQ
jgi:hypothetical protein